MKEKEKGKKLTSYRRNRQQQQQGFDNKNVIARQSS